MGGYLAEITGYPGARVLMAHLQAPGGGHRVELFQYLAPEGARAEVETRNVGAAHVCFEVEEIHAAYERAVAAGAAAVSPPVAVDTGANAGGFGLYVRDPDGITLELFQPPPAAAGRPA